MTVCPLMKKCFYYRNSAGVTVASTMRDSFRLPQAVSMLVVLDSHIYIMFQSVAHHFFISDEIKCYVVVFPTQSFVSLRWKHDVQCLTTERV